MSELAEVLRDETEKRIDDMLTHYRDALEGQDRAGEIVAVQGGERGYLELPDVWKRSGYPTLERLLAALKLGAACLEGAAIYSHLRGWYFDVRRVRVPAYVWVFDERGRTKLDKQGEPIARCNKQGEPVRRVTNGEEQFELRNRRNGYVDKGRVLAGVSWLAGSWPSQARHRPETLQEITRRLDRERERLKAA